MRPTRSRVNFAAAAFGLALTAGLLAAPTLARAGDDDDTPADTKFLRGILEGIGLQRDGAAGINYQERAPLVIPPNHDLPPPESTTGAIASNPAWPKDPDVQRAKEEKKMERQARQHRGRRADQA